MKIHLEITRILLRKNLHPNSKFYRVGHNFLNFRSALISGQILTYFTLIKNKSMPVGGELVSIKCKELKYPILIRPGTKDAGMIISTIFRKEYGYIKQSVEKVNWIIDGGGYIGDTSAYFLNQYPNTKIIILEPDPDNFKILKLNMINYSERVYVLNKGLYGDNKKMLFTGNTELDSTGGAVKEAELSKDLLYVECISIPTLIEQYGILSIDILKLDIEGAEGAVLDKNAINWLKCVKMIIIEIHSQELLNNISKILKQSKFNMIQYRSVWYCLNSNL